MRPTGIADERAYVFPVYGLVRTVRQRLTTPPWPDHLPHPTRVHILTCGGLGTEGMLEGPATHVADQCGLADPLLARLQALPDPDWRIGHIIRAVPDGYRESLAADADLLKDRQLATLYADLRLVTRAKLWAPGRWSAILRLNTGGTATDNTSK